MSWSGSWKNNRKPLTIENDRCISERKILIELTDEALHRGYTLDEIMSPIPVCVLSKDDQEHLSVYADHFEDVGNLHLAGILRSIIEYSKKHATRKWNSKK